MLVPILTLNPMIICLVGERMSINGTRQGLCPDFLLSLVLVIFFPPDTCHEFCFSLSKITKKTP